MQSIATPWRPISGANPARCSMGIFCLGHTSALRRVTNPHISSETIVKEVVFH